MSSIPPRRRAGRPVAIAPAFLLISSFAFVAALAPAPARADDEDCMACHEDDDLEAESGRKVGVSAGSLARSAHRDVGCRDCHTQPGDYEDYPHFARYQPVACADCHDDATASYAVSFHGKAHARGDPGTPGCVSCHRSGRDAHSIRALGTRTAENACRRCHQEETERYDGGVHFVAANEGKESPGCVGCHQTHTAALPPSAGAVNKLCEACHAGAMNEVQAGGHGDVTVPSGKISCASCHDVHATHRPHLDGGILKACDECHADEKDEFADSVHADVWAGGDMNCLTCHRTHQVDDASEQESFGCGACHEDAEAEYRNSVHRLARLHGDRVAATCGDCHGGHDVKRMSNPNSPTNCRRIPDTCGECHGDQELITSDYVRLPISLPLYIQSVHGVGWKEGKPTAVCTDCHGSHSILAASDSASHIHKENLAVTCGQCHDQESAEYVRSIHGRAVAHGINDSPSCTDCHEEHLIRPHTDPESPIHANKLVSATCARCHENPEMAARYGLPPEVVESYQDSYHGWAARRDSRAVAVCTDCHNTHEIGSVLDPASSIHENNVADTCGRCHPGATQKFAASYAHVLARDKRMPHDWAQLIYIVLLIVVLGGMAVHNLLVARIDLRGHFRRMRKEPSVTRLTRGERFQHLILLVTFGVLAITGFALRFPESWWAEGLLWIGLGEAERRLVHRISAVLMVAASVYHVVYLLVTHRGRFMLKAMFPGWTDVKDALANLRYYLRPNGKERPTFGFFDYTQKAEYWALVWGTIVMGATGLVLWFPEAAVRILPVWAVRVCEVVHFYEAILAVSAIFIWHFFYVIFRPGVFPMSPIWITGQMPEHEWRENHGRAAAEAASGSAKAEPAGD